MSWRNAIASIESAGSGDYSALGPVTRKGDRAYGRYQVMGSNIGPWTRAALGRELSPKEFLASPEAQDAVFDHVFGGYVRQYGSPEEAASVWFTGKPMAQGAGRRDQLGTSGSQYVQRFSRALRGGAGQGVMMGGPGDDQMFDGSSIFGASPGGAAPQAEGFDGSSIFSAAPAQAAMSKPKPAPAAPPQRKVGMAEDAGRGFLGGLISGAGQLADASPITNPMGVVNSVLSLVGRKERLPTNADIARLAPGGDYKPETRAGKFAKTTGEFAAFAPMGAGGGALRTVAGVVAPAVASEGAAQAVEAMGGGEAAQGIARVAGGVAGGVGVGMARRATGPKPLKPPQLKAAKDAAYQAVDQAGVRYKPQAMTGLVTAIDQDLRAERFNPLIHPKVSGVMSEVRKLSRQNPTLTELDQLRQYVRENAVAGATPGEARLGNMIIREIDNFVASARPKHVTAGDAKAASGLIANARDLNTRLRKVEAVQEAVERAELRAASSGTGGNADNAIRQELRRVLEKHPGLKPAERRLLERAVRGGTGQNLLRLLGRFSPTSGLLPATASLGSTAAFGPAGAALGAAGLASKAAADGMTKGNVSKLTRLMAAGGGPAPLPPGVKPPPLAARVLSDPRVTGGLVAAAPALVTVLINGEQVTLDANNPQHVALAAQNGVDISPAR